MTGRRQLSPAALCVELLLLFYPKAEQEITTIISVDGFICSASANQPTGEQNVKTAAAPDAVKSHRQRGGGQEQSKCWYNEDVRLLISVVIRGHGVFFFNGPPVH